MNEIQEIRQTIQQLLQAIQQVIQSGEVLTDEFQGKLAKTLEFLIAKGDDLEAQGKGIIDQAPKKEGDLTPSMPSSNISEFGYDDKTGRLLVRFLGDYPNRQGAVYSYSGVPKQIFDLFQRGAVPARTTGKNKWGKWWKGKNPSMGASLYTLIKGGNYPYQRLS